MGHLEQVKIRIQNDPVLQLELKEEMFRLITYIEKNPKIKYFPLTKIKSITKSNNTECMNIAIYFCGETLKIFEPRYSYILEGNQEIELTKSEFKYYLYHRQECLSKDGYVICPVLKERLFFYFTTSLSTYSDDEDWEID
ncbi:hypothetical protein ES815_22240 [Leclercia adecarboxylata]|uniref:Uncharacterized protein n=1 Tax=Leclercia adecarboxylata TaxID=83655 RepID=A0AAP9DDM5_9ENTR|nr:hypothetical protein [Leclercia adecarboxylata]QDK20883.1 hypothetical protein ES815_22240 [Leclercia adecarboxylata]